MTPEKINELAQECIDGKWGNGRARKSNLEKAGYEYEPIRKRVEELRAEMKQPEKTVDAKSSESVKEEKKEEPKKEEKKSEPKSSGDSHFKETEKELPEELKETLTPSEYFEKVKDKLQEETPENVKRLFDVTMKQLKRFTITGQKAAAKELYAKCLYLEKEMKLLEKGLTKYVKRTDIDHYIDDVADDCVCVIEMSNFDRPIPDEIIDKIGETMDIFDEFYIVFTDYTGEKRSKVAKEKRDKDPIVFGNIFIDGKLSPKMYFIGDWIDDYCDLTLDKMISEIAKSDKKEESEILYDITNESDLDNIEEKLFGTTKRASTRTVAGN